MLAYVHGLGQITPYANAHTPEMNGLHGKNGFSFICDSLLKVFVRPAKSFLNIFLCEIYIFP